MQQTLTKFNGTATIVYSTRTDRMAKPPIIGRVVIDHDQGAAEVNCNTCHGYVYEVRDGRTISSMFLVEDYPTLEALLDSNIEVAVKYIASALYHQGEPAVKLTFHFTRLGYAVEINVHDYPEF